jgi:hypothetical protein
MITKKKEMNISQTNRVEPKSALGGLMQCLGLNPARLYARHRCD